MNAPFFRPAWFLKLGVLIACGFLSVAHAPAQDEPAVPAPPPNPFFIHDGDTPVVFIGEGATEQRMYSTLIETYALTRFPDWNISFRNAGWEGDTASLSKRGGYDTAFPRDVMALQPKLALIKFGLSDAEGGDANFSPYLKYLTKQVKDLVAGGSRVVLITPTPREGYEFQQPGGSRDNVGIGKYVDGMKIVSDNERVPLIDLYTPFLSYIAAGRKSGLLSANEDASARLTLDGVHPNWGGHLIMATIMLQKMKAPADVSSVVVDAAAKSIVSSDGCTVDWQDMPNGVVQIKRSDRLLPWPIPDDPSIDLVLKFPGFDPLTALDRYGFKVTGLKEASYKLSIDGKEVGTYANADLANGVNLALVRQGPIYDQLQQLLQVVNAKNDAYFERWRDVQLYQPPDWLKGAAVENARNAEMARLDKVVSDSEKAIQSLRQPVPHLFRLDPVAAAPTPAK